MRATRVSLLAGGTTGRLKAIHLGLALAAEAAVPGFSILLFTGTVVESSVWIDPYLCFRISWGMNERNGFLGDSEGH